MNIDDLSKTVLDQRQQRGQGENGLRMCRGYCRRLLDAYALVADSRTYDKGALDRTLDKLHRDVEEGSLPQSAFKHMRRMAADIEDVADFGVIGKYELPSWGEYRNPLCRPLSEEARRDLDSIVGVAATTYDLLAAEGLAEDTLYGLKHVFLLRILRFFDERGEERYSEELMEEYLDELASHEYEWGREKLFCMRWAARHVMSVHNTGALYERRGPGAVKRAMSGPFGDLLREYEQWMLTDSGRGESTVVTRVANVARFLEALRALGLEDLSLLTRELVRSARRIMCEGVDQSYACRLLESARSLAAFAEQRHPELPAFGTWVGRNPKRRRKMPIEGYSREQSDAIISSIDLSKPAGPRDSAIATLARNTALRGVDVRKLRRDEIDWHRRTISIVQSKTGRPLVLPLDTETGTAIANYLLGPREERGECDNLVFLTVQGEPGPLTGSYLNDIVRKHAKPALGEGYKGPHGTHSFRRGAGREMTDAGVPLEDVAEFLGHGDARSADSYAAVAFGRLRTCAAGLDAAPAERIWWLK